ncbi:ATP-binding protein [Caulobacter segnis]|uniref:ATP-binding protein n=1 Tax=Caulobacter segnis TaxID=88688 RepID=UPI00285A27D7|nr:ATP-binding protein [Caulobacter segnis]MDR6626495.1 signal transduction histidine kinase/ActR/RegA family two-component response regulator [Caulobacter segnis]
MSAVRERRQTVHALASRRANTSLRLIAAFAIALILDVFIHLRWVWAWATIYAALQVVELWGNRWVRGRSERVQALWRGLTVTALPFLTSTVFGFLSLPLFASHARFAPTLGGMLLAGALLNVVVINGSRRSAIISAATPYVLYLLIVPLVARAANPDSPLANALWFGALLLVATVTITAHTLHTALEAEARAKDEAERRRHEAEEAVAAKSAFVAMISHELRTPISAIMAGAARLHGEAPDASAKVQAQLIADAGGLMRGLLNDLLDFSRLEAGRMSVEKEPFNLRQTIADTVRLWRPEATRKGLRLRVKGAAALPRWVAGDVMRLRQVLNNLLSNALKFTARGEITVSPRAEIEGSRVLLSIEVNDTGPGIPEASLARLFTPFEQLDDAIARHHGGSGLGLVISRELARLMGGDLTASSTPGQGARFTLRAKLDIADAPVNPSAAAPITDLRVLVVDDHLVNRRALELVLEPLGVRATLAESAEQALELLRSEVFDVVLMDVYMPGMDGRAATRVLRATSGPNQHAPVIAVTASVDPKDWEACAAAGMTDHVSKPIDPFELHAALARAPAIASRSPTRGPHARSTA